MKNSTHSVGWKPEKKRPNFLGDIVDQAKTNAKSIFLEQKETNKNFEDQMIDLF